MLSQYIQHVNTGLSTIPLVKTTRVKHKPKTRRIKSLITAVPLPCETLHVRKQKGKVNSDFTSVVKMKKRSVGQNCSSSELDLKVGSKTMVLNVWVSA